MKKAKMTEGKADPSPYLPSSQSWCVGDRAGVGTPGGGSWHMEVRAGMGTLGVLVCAGTGLQWAPWGSPFLGLFPDLPRLRAVWLH